MNRAAKTSLPKQQREHSWINPEAQWSLEFSIWGCGSIIHPVLVQSSELCCRNSSVFRELLHTLNLPGFSSLHTTSREFFPGSLWLSSEGTRWHHSVLPNTNPEFWGSQQSLNLGRIRGEQDQPLPAPQKIHKVIYSAQLISTAVF